MTHLADATALIAWEDNNLVPMQRKLADFVQQLQSTIETNNQGIPMKYIDPNVVAECVPYAKSVDDIPEEKFQQAFVNIEFEDGIPVIDGVPFWERLDGERIDYYKIFKEYRDMKYTDELGYEARSIAKLADNMKVPGRLLTILSKIYHWTPRTKAFDIYKARQFELQKAKQREQLESKHAKTANELLEQALSYIQKHPNALNPKVALQMIELGMKYGRISVGLQGDKPGTANAPSYQTNIAIHQSNTINEADQMINVTDNSVKQGGKPSEIERKFSEKMQDNSTLVSILHVLNKSGAFTEAASRNMPNNPDIDTDTDTDADTNTDTNTNAEIIEVNYSTSEAGDEA